MWLKNAVKQNNNNPTPIQPWTQVYIIYGFPRAWKSPFGEYLEHLNSPVQLGTLPTRKEWLYRMLNGRWKNCEKCSSISPVAFYMFLSWWMRTESQDPWRAIQFPNKLWKMIFFPCMFSVNNFRLITFESVKAALGKSILFLQFILKPSIYCHEQPEKAPGGLYREIKKRKTKLQTTLQKIC